MDSTSAYQIVLPTRSKGRQSAQAVAKFDSDLARFAEGISEINSALGFKCSARGWCYVLEEVAGLSKGDFDKAGNVIVLCRKRGLLPLDIVAEDEKRSFYNVQNVSDCTPEEYAEAMLMELPCIGMRNDPPRSFSAAQDVIPEGRAGYCVSNIEELSTKLTCLMDDPALAERLGQYALQLARERYVIDK